MKFAKELERDLVPEWRAKYLDYKAGKKKLKAIERAVRALSQTPRTPAGRRRAAFPDPSPFDQNNAPAYAFLNRQPTESDHAPRSDTAARSVSYNAGAPASRQATNASGGMRVPTSDSAAGIPGEQQPLTWGIHGNPRPGADGMTRYGSIIGSPPRDDGRGQKPPTLSLPEPALDAEEPQTEQLSAAQRRLTHVRNSLHIPHKSDKKDEGNAYEVGRTRHPPVRTTSLTPRYKSIFQPKRVNSMPSVQGASRPDRRPFMRRLLSSASGMGQTPPTEPDVQLEAYREVDFRQAEFFTFLDKEMEKIETFYRAKEDEATDRLQVIREQLHIMRDKRLDEIMALTAAKKKKRHVSSATAGTTDGLLSKSHSDSDDDLHTPNGEGILKKSLVNPLNKALHVAKTGKFGKGTQAMQQLATPGLDAQDSRPEHQQDYVRKSHPNQVPYRVAKRKLKIAMQEYYRGLELLKSYALLNRTAFRKINKKYDKTVHARPSGRYMAEKVNKAWFVQSEVVDGHIREVEDLYARYFERGNHKVAVGKLRIKMTRAGDFTAAVFRNGLLVAAGAVFGVEGLVKAINLIMTADPVVHLNTGFLLQIYAGYFLLLLLFMLFLIDCRAWSIAKINYVFVFEYDTRTHIDWRQLFELPCLFGFLLGVTIWLNFTIDASDPAFLYWPVILMGLTLVILCFPAPILYHRSRKWFLYSCWRLFFAGLYPVEFRDFFLGDMACSLTYATGQIPMFFCLYARDWNDPPQCNSSHSRLFGFFSALPGIWRALQCLRRYHDTRNIFPHLVNCGKYTATILYYVSLSMWRMEKTSGLKAFFILCATVNGIYTSIWDLVMDWSLLDPYSHHRFLRDTLGYKRPWLYYCAMVIDPILRFNWIFYVIFANDVQHSTVVSFAIAFSEVCRRGIWTLFRVENEHCTNVGRFRASRDIPLPYDVPSPTAHRSPQDFAPPRSPPLVSEEGSPISRRTTTSRRHDVEQGTGRSTGRRNEADTVRRRRKSPLDTPDSPAIARGLSRVGTILHTAHAQDFERRRPEAMEDGDRDESSDDEDGDGGGETAEEDEERQEEAEMAEGLAEREDRGEGSSGEELRSPTDVQDVVEGARDGSGKDKLGV